MKYLVIGCGISGAVIARKLAENGEKVTIVDRRNHIAGNMYDYIDEHGFLVQKYGPHIFHTNNDRVFEFINDYGEWNDFKLECGAVWDGKYTPTPFNFKTVDTFFASDKAIDIKESILRNYKNVKTATVVELLMHEDNNIRDFANYLFENDYAPYTAKQWGMRPQDVDISVLKRVPVILSYDTGYFDDKYQVMPKKSYTDFVYNLLAHPNIELQLNIEASNHLEIKENQIIWDKKIVEEKVIYTGALDELFKSFYGNLPYRSLDFEWKYEEIDSLQNAPVVAYPKATGYTRITEYKKLPIQEGKGTSYAIEYPLPYLEEKKMEPYYPVLTEKSMVQYEKYKILADKIKNLVCCGRLANFKYYNMDEAIENALMIADNLLK